MLGTVGEDERMDGSVISDAVNVCSRMEGLTKFYKVPVIITEDTLKKLTEPEKYHIRFLDKVRVKGRTIPILIYELYSADPASVLEEKNRSKEAMEEGISLYFEQKFHEAFEVFSALHKDYPDDTVIALYMRRSQMYKEKGTPDDWAAVETFDLK